VFLTLLTLLPSAVCCFCCSLRRTNRRYDDDKLMSSAFMLLESNYGQRRQLREALASVELLEGTGMPG